MADELRFRPNYFFPFILILVAVIIVVALMVVPPAKTYSTDQSAKKTPIVSDNDASSAQINDRKKSAPESIANTEYADSEPSKTEDESSEPVSFSRTRPGNSQHPGTKPSRTKSTLLTGWEVAPGEVSSSLFLFDYQSEGGLQHRFLPARMGERYLTINFDITWHADAPAQVLIKANEGIPPTILIRANMEPYGPLGEVVEKPSPLKPVSAKPISIPPGSPKQIQLIYKVPRLVDKFTVLVEGKPLGEITAPTNNRMNMSRLGGTWKKVPGTITRLKHGHSLIDAIANPNVDTMEFRQAAAGFTLMSFPVAGVEGDGPVLMPDGTAATITLTQGETTIQAFLRLLDEDRQLLVTFENSPNSWFLFEQIQ